MSDEENFGIPEPQPEDYELEVVRYNKPATYRGRVADRALDRIGDDDAWSKSTLRKVAVVSRWRRFKSFLWGMLPAFVRTRLEPRPPFND